MLKSFPSTRYSEEHNSTLVTLDNLAKNGVISESQHSETAGRVAFWLKIKNIQLNAPKLNIVDTNESNIRSVPLPTSISKYIGEFCSGCIDTAVYIMDRLTVDLSAMVDINKKYEQLEHLQKSCSFLILKYCAPLNHQNLLPLQH